MSDMKPDLKIEWTYSQYLDDTDGGMKSSIPVVRLDAVDEILKEAVWIAESLHLRIVADLAETLDAECDDIHVQRMACNDPSYIHAQAFLTSPLVAAWRGRQKKEEP